MIGAKLQTLERASQVRSPGVPRAMRQPDGAGSQPWRWIATLLVFAPLSAVLVQCGQAPSAGTLAANVQASSGASFDDRFPRPQFRDRFPTASESFEQRQLLDPPRRQTAQTQPAPYRVASLAPTVPYQRPPKEDQTTLVSLKSSAFPYFGNNPHTDEPFLNISRGDRKGHRTEYEIDRLA